MNNFDAVELKIKEALIAFTDEAKQVPYKGDGLWTYKIKEKLGDLGVKEFGCKVCTSGFRDYFDNEWLFDFVWYQENAEGQLINIPLIAESEWHLDWKHIKFDFEKLLQSNAEHRLMICQVHPSKKELVLNNFNSLIQSYQLNCTGDHYMLADLTQRKESMI